MLSIVQSRNLGAFPIVYYFPLFSGFEDEQEYR